jgi:hypothetical protein
VDARGFVDDPCEVLVTLEPDSEATPEEVEVLSQRLRTEVARLDIEALKQVSPQTDVPAGAKGDPVMWTSMLVSLSAAGGVFTSLLALLQDWLGRQATARRISVTIGDDKIELDRASEDEKRRLIEAFVRRHTSD